MTNNSPVSLNTIPKCIDVQVHCNDSNEIPFTVGDGGHPDNLVVSVVNDSLNETITPDSKKLQFFC